VNDLGRIGFSFSDPLWLSLDIMASLDSPLFFGESEGILAVPAVQMGLGWMDRREKSGGLEKVEAFI